jgi:hypothetical protein
MRLTASAAEGFEHFDAKLIYDPPEIIVLHDRDDKPIEYLDNSETNRMRMNLVTINEALSATTLTYQGNLIRTGEALSVGDIRIIAHQSLYRIFNRANFECGGRFCGPWWQNVPSETRAEIEINGSRTIEADYSQLHPRLLYAMAAKSLGADAYRIDGWERPLVKQATNTLINADDELSALQSIAQKIGGKGAFARARTLIEQIRDKHRGIADCFGSGEGLRLMKIDSEMAESVQLKLIGRGIISLPVHDSFVVEARHAGALEEIMGEVLELTLRGIGGNSRAPIEFGQKVPQYGDGGIALSGRPAVAVEREPANDDLPSDSRSREAA